MDLPESASVLGLCHIPSLHRTTLTVLVVKMEGEGRGAGLHGCLAPECQLLSIRARVCSWLPLLPYLTFLCLWFVSVAEASGFSFPCFLVGIPPGFRLSVAPRLIFEQECLEPSTRHFCGFDIGRGGGAWEKAQPWTVASSWCREPSLWPRGFWLLPSRALGRSPCRFPSWGPLAAVLWCGAVCPGPAPPDRQLPLVLPSALSSELALYLGVCI